MNKKPERAKVSFTSKKHGSKITSKKGVQFKPSAEAMRMRRDVHADEKELKSYLPPM